MKPPPFDYVAPASATEAVALLADDSREARILAGGQSLIPVLSMRLARPDVLVDICRIPDLAHFEIDLSGDLVIGAAVTQAAVETDVRVRRGWPLLAAALGRVAHPQVRNRGTVCGSLAHHDPAAELPAVAVALGARMSVTGPSGEREIPATEFFTGTFQTALRPDELLAAVRFPAAPGPAWGFEELTRRHADFAIVGVAVQMRRRDGVVERSRIVGFGLGGAPVRLRDAERAIAGHTPNDAVAAAVAAAATTDLDPPADAHGDARFRRDATRALLVRAVLTAWRRSTDGR